MIAKNKYILPLLLASILSACGEQPTESNLENSVELAVDAYSPLKGAYVWGEGVEAFTPCGQNKDYWVFPYTEKMWEQLRDEHQNLTAKPYDEVYVEINGVLGPKLHPIVGGEHAADYDGHVVIESINLIRRKSEFDCEQ